MRIVKGDVVVNELDLFLVGLIVFFIFAVCSFTALFLIDLSPHSAFKTACEARGGTFTELEHGVYRCTEKQP